MITQGSEIQIINGIPIRNLWWLILYASQLLRLNGSELQDIEKTPDLIPDLIVELFCRSVEARLKRELKSDFVPVSATLSRLRGRINLIKTIENDLLSRGLVSCDFEDLTLDTELNRFVLAALQKSVRLTNKKDLKYRAHNLSLTFKQLGICETNKKNISYNHPFGRNSETEKEMLATARLIMELLLPLESKGTNSFSRLSQDERWLRKVFEKGIAGFYKFVLPSKEWDVTAGKRIEWPKLNPLTVSDFVASNRGDN